MKQLIDCLEQEQTLPRGDWIRLLEDFTPEDATYLCERARHVRQMHYQNRIFIRGPVSYTHLDVYKRQVVICPHQRVGFVHEGLDEFHCQFFLFFHFRYLCTAGFLSLIHI